MQAHLNEHRMFDERSCNLTGAPGWPRPAMGPWELRTVWVLEERTLPSNTEYCYGDRVSYVDEDTFVPLGFDIYDRSAKLWKVASIGFAPNRIGDGHGSVTVLGNTRAMKIDLINSHATVTVQTGPGAANGQVPVKYRDVQVWALPAGLPQMNP